MQTVKTDSSTDYVIQIRVYEYMFSDRKYNATFPIKNYEQCTW